MKIKTIISIIILTHLLSGCGKKVDMKALFWNHHDDFKKIENPAKINQRFVIEKSAYLNNYSPFDSTYMANFEKVFIKTDLNIAYINDGDVLIGYKGNLTKLFFTNKNVADTIELLNFRGSLNYLLKNGKSQIPPFAIQISQEWYIVRDIESF